MAADRSASGGARLELRGVTKAFPGVLANDKVSFTVQPGEIHALLGENGAGKSTLVKMIYGVTQPDAGEIRWNGAPVGVSSPRAARKLGVGMVFQHFSLFEALSVTENIALGLDVSMRPGKLAARIREVLDAYGLALDPSRIVSSLSVGERQRIEIVRALLLEPELLIMDEPTSVLTPQEAAQLFETLRQLAARGCSVLYISHKLKEIQELCDAATILRGGKVVAECQPRRETAGSMAEMMIGAGLAAVKRPKARALGAEKLVVEGLSTAGEGLALQDISFRVRAGEILGVAGVAGNGQNELLEVLSGERPAARGSAQLSGGELLGRSPNARRKLGLCAAPEERNGHAAVGEFSLAENAALTGRDRRNLTSFGLVRPAPTRAFAEEIIARFDVRTTGPGALASALSGGNLQKFVIGREILQAPEALIVAQPTWGVDAGAAAVIHQALLDLAAKGCAIVLISQDLDELLAIVDQLAVINEGRLSPARETGAVSIEALGLLMGGVHGAEDSGADGGAEEAAYAG
ncbi:MAG: ABC transporter ATP-binding protein [Neomegalonema sp.]|nr:ABC transporter ATP-binding protein [Neomegalonema sp.]